ncbi:tyrosine-protein phosphatase [Loigolactobacillus binensis]|uniref:Tyrosine-protein phosphatase n=1 Tax=Loigolactobacillus binensis TaxID=2559922 RepID=A0ABW3E9E6_9LACO|nr:tyrosine-protein phosphatase [Loigolactobacillus binensis]
MEPQRVLDLEGGINFRELGGYPTTDGRQVKWQKILRAGGLDELTPSDIAALGNYGLRYDVDLRSEHEMTSFPDRLPAATKLIPAPVYPFTKRDALSGLNIQLKDQHWAMFSQVYQQMVADPHPQQAWRAIFQAMLAATGKQESVVFHCAAGKDRTGVGAMLVLSALGVTPETIKRDYLLTNQIFGAGDRQSLQQVVAQNESEDLSNRMNQTLSVEDANFDAVFATLQALGGIERYLIDQLGLTTADIATLRTNYLE